MLKGGEGVPYLLQTYLEGGFFSPIQVFSRVRVSLRGSSPPKIIWEGGPLEVFCRGMTLKGEEGGVPQERRGEIPFSLSLFRGSFSSNNNGRVKSPLFIQPQFGPGSAEKWEGREGGVFQNPTTLPFFFFFAPEGVQISLC